MKKIILILSLVIFLWISNQAKASLYDVYLDSHRAIQVEVVESESEKLLKAQKELRDELSREAEAANRNLIETRTSSGYMSTYGQCDYPVPTGCSTSEQAARQRALNARSGLLGSGMDNSLECQNQANDYQRKLNAYNACIQNAQIPQRPSYEQSVPRSVPNQYQESTDYEKQALELIIRVQRRDSVCRDIHGAYSHYSGQIDGCTCDEGTVASSDRVFQCVVPNKTKEVKSSKLGFWDELIETENNKREAEAKRTIPTPKQVKVDPVIRDVTKIEATTTSSVNISTSTEGSGSRTSVIQRMFSFISNLWK